MAEGVCNSGVSCSNTFIEIFHLILVIWNIFTDFRLLFEIKSTSSSYDKHVKDISSAETNYKYTFCYPENNVPKWYIDIDNKTLNTCHCTQSSFICNDNMNDTISPDISCDTEIYGLREHCQQTLFINSWTCHVCDCSSGNIYSDTSLPVQRLYYEYDTMTDLGYGYEYCDPQSIISGKLSGENHLNELIICSITFLVIGSLAWCCSTIIRGFTLLTPDIKNKLSKAYDKVVNNENASTYEKTDEHEARLLVSMVRMGTGLFGNMFHDIPHQIILLFYVRFLYSDYGYNCLTDFLNYPQLHAVTFNSNEDLGVILARNYPVVSSVIAWTSLVVFNAGWNTYQTYIEFDGATRAGADTILKEAKNAYDCKGCKTCSFYLALTVFFFVYIFSHWCWPAFVAYYFVAPALHKTWFVSQIIFWCGVWIWPVFIIGSCIGLCIVIREWIQ